MAKKFKKTFGLLLTLISIALTSCSGTVGPQGPQGEQGIPGIDGSQGEQGPQGLPGKDGVSVVSIGKTYSDGLIDTYTIAYSDGTTSTFTVTNGANGAQGIQGEPGADGHTPVITIGANGNWFVDGVDTGIPAQGPQGEKGDKGVKVKLKMHFGGEDKNLDLKMRISYVRYKDY